MKVTLTIIGDKPSNRSAQIGCVHDDGSQGFTFLLDAPSCRNVAKVLTDAADKMERTIEVPGSAVVCPMCAGLNKRYDPLRVMYPNGLWMHASTLGLAFPAKCEVQDNA